MFKKILRIKRKKEFNSFNVLFVLADWISKVAFITMLIYWEESRWCNRWYLISSHYKTRSYRSIDSEDIRYKNIWDVIQSYMYFLFSKKEIITIVFCRMLTSYDWWMKLLYLIGTCSSILERFYHLKSHKAVLYPVTHLWIEKLSLSKKNRTIILYNFLFFHVKETYNTPLILSNLSLSYTMHCISSIYFSA